MAALAEVPLLHQPGEAFTYNTAFDILGVLVARATGRTFADHLDRRILRPLGMSETGFRFPEGSDPRRTTWYRAADCGLDEVDGPHGQWASPPPFESGAGGLVSTLHDLLAFQRMLLARGGEVLPPDLVDEMVRDQLTPEVRATDTVFLDGQSWGFGGGVDLGCGSPWHVPGRYGWVGGTGTSAHIVPSDGTIAILLTQVELGGPAGAAVLESFWSAVAAR